MLTDDDEKPRFRSLDEVKERVLMKHEPKQKPKTRNRREFTCSYMRIRARDAYKLFVIPVFPVLGVWASVYAGHSYWNQTGETGKCLQIPHYSTPPITSPSECGKSTPRPGRRPTSRESTCPRRSTGSSRSTRQRPTREGIGSDVAKPSRKRRCWRRERCGES